MSKKSGAMLGIGWRFRRGLVRRPPTALHPRWGSRKGQACEDGRGSAEVQRNWGLSKLSPNRKLNSYSG